MMQEAYTTMQGLITGKMKIIEEISLSDEKYNTLYLELRALNQQLWKVIRADHEVEKEVKDNEFWTGMKSIRSPKAPMPNLKTEGISV